MNGNQFMALMIFCCVVFFITIVVIEIYGYYHHKALLRNPRWSHIEAAALIALLLSLMVVSTGLHIRHQFEHLSSEYPYDYPIKHFKEQKDREHIQHRLTVVKYKDKHLPTLKFRNPKLSNMQLSTFYKFQNMHKKDLQKEHQLKYQLGNIMTAPSKKAVLKKRNKIEFYKNTPFVSGTKFCQSRVNHANHELKRYHLYKYRI